MRGLFGHLMNIAVVSVVEQLAVVPMVAIDAHENRP